MRIGRWPVLTKEARMLTNADQSGADTPANINSSVQYERAAYGIRIWYRKERDRWMVSWRTDAKQRSKSFMSRESAELWASGLRGVRAEAGELPDAKLWSGVRDLLHTIESGGVAKTDAEALASLRRCVDFWKNTAWAAPESLAALWWRHRRELLHETITLGDAMSRFIAVRKAESRSEAEAYRVEHDLTSLCATLGSSRLLESVESEDLREWLRIFAKDKSDAWWGKKRAIGHVRGLYKRGIAEGWCMYNPATQVKVAQRREGEVSVLSPDDGEKLFKSLRRSPLGMRLALEAFGGLRCSSAFRLRHEDILWQDKVIMMPGFLHKSGRRQVLEGLPANLWAWLNRWRKNEAAWRPLNIASANTAKSAAFTDAKVPHPNNVLRHSFCTYHVALLGDAARTATLMQHRSPAMLYRHYKGVGTHADALRWFAITPQSGGQSKR